MTTTTTPQSTVTIELTAAAQRAALLAGQPAQAEQTYPVTQADLAALLALPGTYVRTDGSAHCNRLRSPSPSKGDCSIPPLDARPASAAEAIAAIAAAQAALDAQYAAAQAAQQAALTATREALDTAPTPDTVADAMRAGVAEDMIRAAAEQAFADWTPDGTTHEEAYLVCGEAGPARLSEGLCAWDRRHLRHLRVPAFDALIHAVGTAKRQAADAANAEREAKAAAERAAAEAKRAADLQSLDAALKRVLSPEDMAAVYAGEHAAVPCGVLALDEAKGRVLDVILPLQERAKLRAPRDYAGDACSGKFQVIEGDELELTLDEARRALQVRADVTRALNAAPEGLVAECSAELREHVFVADDADDLGGDPPPRNIGLRVRVVLAGGAVVVRELAVA